MAVPRPTSRLGSIACGWFPKPVSSESRDLVPNLAHVPLAGFIVGHVVARVGIERGNTIHQKAINITAARQFRSQTPNTINPFAQREGDWFGVLLNETNDHLNGLRVGRIQ